MRTLVMRTRGQIVTWAVGILWLAAAGAAVTKGQEPKTEKAAETSADKVKDLQKERVAAFREMVEVESNLFRIAQSSHEALYEAKAALHEAEAAAAENGADRVAALKSLVEVLKGAEELAKARKQAARGTQIEILKAKARRLEAEIRLEQAQVVPVNAPAVTQGKSDEPSPEKLIVTSPQVKDVTVAEHFIGQINSRRHIEIRSLQRGYLEEVLVKEGQAVKQGDMLFKLAPSSYKAKLEAEAAAVEIATLNLKNSERLFQNKVISEDEVAILKAKLAAAQAGAKSAQQELSLTIVRAPFDGLVGRVRQEQGSLVTDRDVLTTLSDNKVMWVYFNVPQTRYLEYMANADKDEEVEVQLTLSGERKFAQAGKIGAVEAQFDKETGTIPFRADFPNPDDLLRHGMTGNLSMQRTLKQALIIPQRATLEVLGKRYVFVVDKDDVAHQREVVVQSEREDDFVIKQGLSANDRLVLQGLRQVADGEKLQYELQKPLLQKP